MLGAPFFLFILVVDKFSNNQWGQVKGDFQRKRGKWKSNITATTAPLCRDPPCGMDAKVPPFFDFRKLAGITASLLLDR